MTFLKTMTCQVCNGTGQIEGTFKHRPWDCMACDRFGVVHAHSQIRLTKGEQVEVLKDRLFKRNQEIARLQAHVERLKPYEEKALAAEIAEKAYPKDLTEARRRNGQGGYGD